MVDQQQKLNNLNSTTQLSLNLSTQGDLKISGNLNPEILQQVLDASLIKQKIFTEHQTRLERENNQTSIYIGLFLSGLIGLTAFCLFNVQKPIQRQYSTQSLILGIQKNA